MANSKKLTPDERGIISGAELMKSIIDNEPIEPINGAIVEDFIQLNSVSYDHKLVLHNITFREHFDVSEAHFKRSVDLTGCVFEQNINFSDTEIERNLVLTEAEIKATQEKFQNLANFERSYVKGILDTRALQANVKLNLNYSQIGNLVLHSLAEKQTVCNEEVSLIGAKIVHELNCSGTKIAKDLILQSTEIQGDLFCNLRRGYCTEVGGDVWMIGAKISGRADFSGAKIGGDLELQIADIQGALDCKPEQDEQQQWHYTEIGGKAILSGAKISPLVNFCGAKITKGLSLERAEINGNVFCESWENRQTRILGKANCVGVQVTGSMKFSGAIITNDLDLKGANIKENLFCQSEEGNRTEIGGRVNLTEAQVFGSVDFSGAKIFGDLDLKRAEIKSKLDCEVKANHRTEIGKNINLAGTKVLGSVNFRGAQIAQDLVLKGVEIAGSLKCHFTLPSESSTDAENVEKIYTEVGNDVNLIRARISSSVDLKYLKIQGNLKLEGAEFSSNFSCNINNINLRKNGNKEINFKECTIRCLNIEIDLPLKHSKSSFSSKPTKPASSSKCSKLNLAFTKVIKLIISPQKDGLEKSEEFEFNSEGFEFNLEGFEYQQLELPENEESTANKYIQFLAATQPFDEGTYLFMENWLRNQGAQLDANRVYTEMRRRNRRETISSDIKLIRKWRLLLKSPRGRLRLIKILWIYSFQQVYDWVLDFTIRYGTATNRLFFFYFLPVLMCSWLLFYNLQSVELDWTVTAGDLNNSHVIKRSNQQKPQLLETKLLVHPTRQDWTSMNAFWLGVKTTIPVIPFAFTDKWTPSSQPIVCFNKKWCSISYDTYAKFTTLLGWITVPLFLAGISGIVKRQP
ncbi:hypothetical protein NUACC21_71030 [Scytonema sp. NUACC21]